MLTNKRIASQGFHCGTLIADVLAQTLLKRRPADRSLSSAFFEHREFGSRDRRLVSETLFSVLRWWGWLKHLAPAEFRDAVEHPEKEPHLSFPLEAFYPMFSMAWYMEGKNELPPAADWWFEEAGLHREDIHFLQQGAPALERKRYLKPLLPPGTPALKENDLLPSWCFPFIDSPKPLPELIEWLQHRPPVWLRAMPGTAEEVLKELSGNDFKASLHPTMPNAIRLDFAGGNLRGLKAFREGKFEIQDLASQCVALVCDPKPGQRWWDACAGGGGKTLHLASLMNQQGTVLASDIRTRKLDDLKLRARRGQFPNIRYKEWKGKEMPRFRSSFHGVLVDTPCSCAGTWRRNPDGRWTTFEPEIPEFNALQAQLLQNASEGVLPGGTLVYSTCSMFHHENRDIVLAFLEKHPDFHLVPFTCPINGQESDGIQQLWPWDGDCDAMFISKMIREK